MAEEAFVVAELDGVSVVSVVRVDDRGHAVGHAYELQSDGVVRGTFPTLIDVFRYLNAEGF